jgi:hypothetical protein
VWDVRFSFFTRFFCRSRVPSGCLWICTKEEENEQKREWDLGGLKQTRWRRGGASGSDGLRRVGVPCVFTKCQVKLRQRSVAGWNAHTGNPTSVRDLGVELLPPQLVHHYHARYTIHLCVVCVRRGQAIHLVWLLCRSQTKARQQANLKPQIKMAQEMRSFLFFPRIPI